MNGRDKQKNQREVFSGYMARWFFFIRDNARLKYLHSFACNRMGFPKWICYPRNFVGEFSDVITKNSPKAVSRGLYS